MARRPPFLSPQCPPGCPQCPHCCGAALQAVVGIGDVEAGRCAAGESPGEGLNSPRALLAPRLQEQPDLRQSSIVLFGNLTKFSEEDCEAFFEQILNGLVTLLLHLQDPKPEVVKVSAPLPASRHQGAPPVRGTGLGWPRGAEPPGARRSLPLSVPQACKFALRMCGPNMGCEGLCDMFLNHLREDRSLHYGEFMNNVCKHLVSAAGAHGAGAGAAKWDPRGPAQCPCVLTGTFPLPAQCPGCCSACPAPLGLQELVAVLQAAGRVPCLTPLLPLLPQMQSYPEMLNRLISTNLFYFKSNWVDIRAAAPMFIGESCPQASWVQRGSLPKGWTLGVSWGGVRCPLRRVCSICCDSPWPGHTVGRGSTHQRQLLHRPRPAAAAACLRAAQTSAGPRPARPIVVKVSRLGLQHADEVTVRGAVRVTALSARSAASAPCCQLGAALCCG